MKQKIMRSGNSLVVTIPADFVKLVGVAAGDQVTVQAIPEKGKMIYKFRGITQLPLAKNLLKRKNRRRK